METDIGYIFMPDKPDYKIESVRLEISSSGIVLEIPKDSYGLLKFDIILGVFNSYNKVTLVDCNYYGNESGGGASISRLKVSFLLKNIHLGSPQDLCFSTAYVNLPSLHNWLNIHIIKNNLFSSNELKVEIPDEIQVTTIKNFKIFFKFDYYKSLSSREVFLKESTYLKIEAINNDVLSFWDLIDIIIHFRKFLLIITNQSPIIEGVSLITKEKSNQNNNSLRPVILKCNWSEMGRETLTCFPYIDYRLIKDCFDKIIFNWYANEELHASIDLILGRSSNSGISSENYFLNSCFALETFHRRYKKLTVFETLEFQNFKKEILHGISNKKFLKRIENLLSHANEPTFKERLIDLAEDFENLLPETEKSLEYIDKIVNTRNYLVHKTKNKNIFSGIDLFYAASYIESVTKINIFRVIGIPNEIIIKSTNCTKGHLSRMHYQNKKLHPANTKI